MSREDRVYPTAARLFPWALSSSYLHAWGSAVFGHFWLSEFEHVCTTFWVGSGCTAALLAVIYFASRSDM